MNIAIAEGIEVRRDQFTDGAPCWIAEDPAIQGCYAYAASREEAIDRLRVVRERYLRKAATESAVPPEYKLQASATWSFSSYGGATFSVLS